MGKNGAQSQPAPFPPITRGIPLDKSPGTHIGPSTTQGLQPGSPPLHRQTLGWLLYKKKVSCSACADWPRAPQNTCCAEQPGVFPHAGNAGIRHLAPSDARETFAHTQHLPGHGSALSQLRETRALVRRREKAIDLGAQFFCTHPTPSPPASELSFTHRYYKFRNI